MRMKRVGGVVSIIMGISIFLSVSVCSAAVPVEGASEEVWRFNCGAEGWDYTDVNGDWWMQDESYTSLYRWGYTGSGTDTADTSDSIAGTDLDRVYQTSRWGDVNYIVEVPNGTYEVRLMFAETHFDAPNERVFDVAINGTTHWNNVDIFSWAGDAANTAMDLEWTVTVDNGAIEVSFPTVYKDQPTISGIEIAVVDVSDDAFLDFIQKKMFWFFMNERNPDTGFVKWGENNWAPGAGEVSSMASNGYALSIYTIGAERGWITREEAYDCAITMLTSVETMIDDSKEGFWWHYVHTGTGDRADSSEISTVDSALFIMGALQAGEYFKDDHPDVLEKAELLYMQMNWQWFTEVHDPNHESTWTDQYINMGWKPNMDIGGSFTISGALVSDGLKDGYFCQNWYSTYSETVFVDLLAIGSPTYSIPLDAWQNMSHPWVYEHGYNYIDFPPLFVHQYHHLYYDFRDIKYYGVDFFLNSQKASLANRNTCVRHEFQRNVAGEITSGLYEEGVWGLTSCGSPTHGYYPYGAEPDGGHDGTVAPTAAITSIMFTEDESISAARKMFFLYKQKIWGLHGFCDSFNYAPGFDYSNWSGNALDNGAMIIGIENYRSGLVMDTFMQNAHVQHSLELVGFVKATGIETCASSEDGDAARAYLAMDNDPATRWASMQQSPGYWEDTPQWLEIDFKTAQEFDGVSINWEAAYAGTYAVQVSDDRMKWTDVYTTDVGDGGVDEIAFAPVSARYLRVYMTGRGTEWGYSIWEFDVQFVPPAEPTNVQVANAATSGVVNITWDNPVNPAFDHVHVYRSESAGDLGILVGDDVTGEEFADTGLVNGRTYYYTVRSVNQQGVESENVDQTSGVPTYTPPMVSLDSDALLVAPGQSLLFSLGATSVVGLDSVWWTVIDRNDASVTDIPGTINGVSTNLAASQSAVVSGDAYADDVVLSLDAPGAYAVVLYARDILHPVPGEDHEVSHMREFDVVVNNTAPVVTVPKTAYTVRRNNRCYFYVTATDADGDDLVLTATDLPSGASFYSYGTTVKPDGTSECRGRFYFRPRHVGEFTVQFSARDSADVETLSEAVTITVTKSRRRPWHYWWRILRRWWWR